jgi:hypothetical protein
MDLLLDNEDEEVSVISIGHEQGLFYSPTMVNNLEYYSRQNGTGMWYIHVESFRTIHPR